MTTLGFTERARPNALVFALLVTLLQLAGCGNDSRQVLPTSDGASGTTGPWKAGIHYTVIPPERRMKVSTAPGQVEVIEVFLYNCPACFAENPRLVLWTRRKADYISVSRMPTVVAQEYRPYARLYYTLQQLGREDLHSAVYDTIHREGNSLVADSDEKTLQVQTAFAVAHSVKESTFRAAYSSQAVTANVERAEKLTRNYQIVHTPTLIINGKYLVDLESAGGDTYFLAIVQDLAELERHR